MHFFLSTRFASLTLAVATVAAALSPRAARAQLTTTVNAADRSNYNGTTRSPLFGAAGNYLAGSLGGGSARRNYFIFNIPAPTLGLAYTSASFSFNSAGFASPQGTETLSLRSIDRTSFASLSDGTAGADGYADLGDGTDYGSANVTAGNATVTITLPASAVTAINQNVGGQFGFGGFVSTLNGVGDEYIGGSSQGSGNLTQLVLTSSVVAAVAPEPSSLPLLGMGLTLGAGMVGGVKRRKAKSKM